MYNEIPRSLSHVCFYTAVLVKPVSWTRLDDKVIKAKAGTAILVDKTHRAIINGDVVRISAEDYSLLS